MQARVRQQDVGLPRHGPLRRWRGLSAPVTGDALFSKHLCGQPQRILAAIWRPVHPGASLVCPVDATMHCSGRPGHRRSQATLLLLVDQLQACGLLIRRLFAACRACSPGTVGSRASPRPPWSAAPTTPTPTPVRPPTRPCTAQATRRQKACSATPAGEGLVAYESKDCELKQALSLLHMYLSAF